MSRHRLTLAAAALSAALAATAGPALADPNPQLVRSVEIRLAQYGLQADVSRFATSTVARLHFELSSREDSYMDKRRTLKHILRTAKYK